MSSRNGQTDSEAMRKLAHRDYQKAFWEMRAQWSPRQLADAIAGGYAEPLPYEESRSRKVDDDEDFHDPADRAIDDRTPIVDFDSTNESDLKKFCDQFRSALVWATRSNNGSGQPDLMQMGARILTIFQVMRPQLKLGMNLRIPKNMGVELRSMIEGNPIELGKFFRRPLKWVRECTSLVQLGKRGYSMTYVLCGDLINSATCAAIGALDNKSRQAANKPIQDFRDTFGGIKSLPMRGKETRKRCKKSQEKK